MLTIVIWLFSGLAAQSTIVAAEDTEAQYDVPEFRTVQDAPPPSLPQGADVKLVTDADFAPYSFLSSAGAPAGLSVELAITACEAAGLRCTVEAHPFGEIMDILARGGADAAITGPRLDETTLGSALMTRPYFRIMGRFVARADSDLAASDPAALAGRRIAVVRETVHASWLKAYYRRSRIIEVETPAAAGAAVRAGDADVSFGDNLQAIFWTAGEASAACCRLLGGAFSDFDYFSRNLAFLIRRDRPELRAAFDYGLDMAQKNGMTARIIRTYLPLSPW
jgi:polar amino acid transport system substrate-binding protein